MVEIPPALQRGSQGFSKLMGEWKRVLKLSRKPRRDEYVLTAKITGLGILLVGLIGFLIRMFAYLSKKLL
jgi:protein transport protein SEC61 subunit gamma-like protein